RQTAENRVRLGFTNPLPVGTDTLTVNNVTDPASNAILPNSKIGFTLTPSPYDIVITEVMPRPAAVLDASGEWFEIHNGAGSAVDMTGWQITDGEGTHTLTSPATINADQYFVFCVGGDSATNGGVPENYVYPYAAGTGMQLNNVADDITLKDGAGVIVASVAYTTAFPWGTGSSMQLKNLAYNPAFDTSWCAADTVWPGSMGDAGTPGLATICPEPFIPDTVTICSIRVQTACGVPTLLNVRVVTRGVITFADTCRKTAYLQSGGCGVTIYGSAVFDTMQGSELLIRPGDSVVVEGYIIQYRGLTEFGIWATFVPVITFISAGHTVTPVEIACTDIGLHADSCRGENFEAEMVRLSNVTFINPVGNFPLADSNFAILCGSDTAYFRLDSCDTALIGTAIPTAQIHITGVLGQYDSVGCACQGYQLLYGGGMTFTPARCADPESLTVIRDGMTDGIVLRWKPGDGQTCNCYDIYWAADAVTVWPTGYTYLAYVVGSTTYTDNLGANVRRFYRVIAGGPNCP
ncbi:MAG: lamin tail domain-containing protein, partial [bacterium]|nr:lamin tail domain-containing protein [bacterium]